MFLALLGLLDIISGILLGISGVVSLAGNGLVFWIAVIGILKGVYSILTAAAGGFFFDILGVLDLAGGIIIFLAFSGITLYFFVYFGFVLALKGIYSIGISFMS